jgi:hypothetical protein
MRLTTIGALLVAMSTAIAFAYTTFAAEKPARVLRHIVMYKFRDEATPDQVQRVIDTFAALPKQIDTIAGFGRGSNVSAEGKSEGFTHCFVVTFRDEAGLTTYLQHPAHAAYVEVVKPVRDKVIVFDYWHDETP